MRGFAPPQHRTLVLLDAEMTSVVCSGPLPLDSIERVEIIRGSGAVQYGRWRCRGVINIITRKPGKNGPQAP